MVAAFNHFNNLFNKIYASVLLNNLELILFLYYAINPYFFLRQEISM